MKSQPFEPRTSAKDYRGDSIEFYVDRENDELRRWRLWRTIATEQWQQDAIIAKLQIDPNGRELWLSMGGAWSRFCVHAEKEWRRLSERIQLIRTGDPFFPIVKFEQVQGLGVFKALNNQCDTKPFKLPES